MAKEVAARSGKPVIIFIRKPRFTAVGLPAQRIIFMLKQWQEDWLQLFEARGGGTKSWQVVAGSIDLSDEEISKRIQYVLIQRENNA